MGSSLVECKKQLPSQPAPQADGEGGYHLPQFNRLENSVHQIDLAKIVQDDETQREKMKRKCGKG